MAKKSERGPFLLKNGTIHTVSNGVIKGDILIDGDTIKEIGENIIPDNYANEIDCNGFDIYPGFIDGGTQLGLSEVQSINLSNDFSENGSFNPHMDALKAVNPNSVGIPVTRTNGITTVITFPTGGQFPGIASLINLHGYTPNQMYAGFRSIVLNFPNTARRGSRERRPNSEIGLEAVKKIGELDKIWDNLELYLNIDSLGKLEGKKMASYNPEMEALKNVFLGGEKMLVEVNKASDIVNAINWLKKHKINAILTGVSEGWQVVDSIKGSGFDVITGPILAVPGRASDRYDIAYKNAGLMHNAGIKVGLRTKEIANVRNLPFHAGFAAAYGMGKEAALRSVTLSIAEILGVEDDYGSIDVGKIANLFICKGDPFEPKTIVNQLFIKGWKVPIENRHTLLYDEFLSRSPGLGE